MSAKEMFIKYFNYAKNKKIILVFVFLVSIFLLSALVLKARREIAANGNYRYRHIMEGQEFSYPYRPADNNKFILPMDGAKKGEIAIIVNSLENAKKNISDIAIKNGGIVYSSRVEYNSGNLRNGTMIVQIPINSFDLVFDNFKAIGVEVIEESIENIPQLNSGLPYPIPMDAQSNVQAVQSEKTPTQDATALAEKVSSIAIAPYPYPGQPQDKGYIKVVFADYGTNANMIVNENSGPGYGQSNMQNIFFAALFLKISLLVVLLGVLVLIFIRITKHLRLELARRREKRKSLIIKQFPKNHKRVVKIGKPSAIYPRKIR